MKDSILIIGAGGMAQAIVYDLLTFEPIHKVVLLDRDPESLERIRNKFRNDNISAVQGDARDTNLIDRLMTNSIAAIGASTYNLHLECCRRAIENGVHWVDLGGNPTVVRNQFALHDRAVAAGVGVVPDAGLAPGLINIVGGYLGSRFDEIDELHFRVGGLPQNPQPPLFYGLVFSTEGLANEYHEPALIIEDGEVKEVQSLTGWERVYFGAPLGTLEAFHTSGGSSTMIETFSGRVIALDYKTLRYPGHLRKIKLLGDLGFWSDAPLIVKGAAGVSDVAPRDMMGALLTKQGFVKDDLVVLLGKGTGTRGGQPVSVEVRMLDYANQETGLTAMARTTGFPATIIVRMLIEGSIEERGVLRQESAIPPGDMFARLGERGIWLTTSEDGSSR